MCARVSVFTFARSSEVCRIILVVEGVREDETVNSGTHTYKVKSKSLTVCVCNLRVILFVKYQKPLFFLCMCVRVCLCMFGLVFIQLDTWRLCADLFFTQSLFSSLLFSAFRFSSYFFSLLFFIIIITFCIDFAQFPPK